MNISVRRFGQCNEIEIIGSCKDLEMVNSFVTSTNRV